MSKHLILFLVASMTLAGAAFADDAQVTAVHKPELEAVETVQSESCGKAALAGIQLQDTAVQLVETDLNLVNVSSENDLGNHGTRCSITSYCRDGSTVSCSGSVCNGASHNCPLSRGYVRCDRRTTWCSAPCPPTYCPTRPGCNYQYYFASGCCIDQNNDPNYYCPTICE
ncbi:MAG: hypothetical protein AAGN66_07625 [Acidobacteriota bacterium]